MYNQNALNSRGEKYGKNKKYIQREKTEFAYAGIVSAGIHIL